MFELLGMSLMLVSLLLLNAASSLVSDLLWKLCKPFAKHWPAAEKARAIFALRVTPPAVALLTVLAVFIPAYLANEPRRTEEVVSAKLALLALASLAVLGLAIWRGAAAWRATRRFIRDWMDHATEVKIEAASVPTYLIDHRFPIVALTGTLRPRLFLARKVLVALSEEEIAAAVAHELGHLHHQDNLRRVLLRIVRDVLMLAPAGRSLDREWSDAAEAAADEYASKREPDIALDLASALVKIARLAPAGARAITPAGTLLMGKDSSGIVWRVQRLMQLAGSGRSFASTPRPVFRAAYASLAAGLALAVISIFVHFPILSGVHSALEWVVTTLR